MIIPLRNLEFKRDVANSIYNFEISETNSKRKKRSRTRFSFFRSNGFKKDENLPSPFTKHLSNFFSFSKRKISLSIVEKLKALFFPFGENTKVELIEFAAARLLKKMDIINLIQKLLEIDKLKMLLLDENQLKLFEQLP